jgi:FlaA1/EpsC-like NDP-sugar epimerase
LCYKSIVAPNRCKLKNIHIKISCAFFYINHSWIQFEIMLLKGIGPIVVASDVFHGPVMKFDHGQVCEELLGKVVLITGNAGSVGQDVRKKCSAPDPRVFQG